MEASAKDMEDKQLKEAMEKSAAEAAKGKEPMDTSSSGGASGSSSSSSNAATSVQPGDKFTEKDVQDLMKYNFGREQVIQELRRNDGDVKTATAALFAKSLKFN